METAADRLERAIKMAGFKTLEAFAVDAGVQGGTLRQQLNRGRVPASRLEGYVEELAKRGVTVSTDWILMSKGPGPMVRDNAPQANVRNPPQTTSQRSAKSVSRLTPFDVGLLIPVYAPLPGSDGSKMKLKGRAARKIPAPGQLGSVRGAFGVTVFDDLMGPYVTAGEVTVVDPTQPPTEGDVCLFIGVEQQDGFHTVAARKLVRITKANWRVLHFTDPKKEYDLARSEWPRAHPILWRGKV